MDGRANENDIEQQQSRASRSMLVCGTATFTKLGKLKCHSTLRGRRENEKERASVTHAKKAHSELNELERKINSTQPTEKETTRSRLARQSTNVNQNNMH